MIINNINLPHIPDKETGPIRILFVCLGNICRSPAADGIMQSIVTEEGANQDWVIDSAGTYGGHAGDLPDNRMRAHARHRGLTLTHRARRFTLSDFDNFDLIIPMDASNEHTLRSMASTLDQETKIVSMINFVTLSTRYDHIPDPYYEGAEGFELVLDLLQNGCANLYDIISRQRNHK